MSDEVNPISSNPSADSTEALAARNPTDAKFMMMTGVSNFAQLQKAAPELAKAMMEAIAHTIMGNMKKSQERIHQINQEAKRYG